LLKGIASIKSQQYVIHICGAIIYREFTILNRDASDQNKIIGYQISITFYSDIRYLVGHLIGQLSDQISDISMDIWLDI